MKPWDVFISNWGYEVIARYGAMEEVREAVRRRLFDSGRKAQRRVDVIVARLKERAEREQPNPDAVPGTAAPWTK